MQTYRLSMIYAVLSRSHLGEANQPTKIRFLKTIYAVLKLKIPTTFTFSL